MKMKCRLQEVSDLVIENIRTESDAEGMRV